MVALRPYQQDIITKCRTIMKQGKRTIIINSACGSGKTLLTAHMLKTASEKGMACWFVVHRRELIKQSIRAFTGEGVRFGVISAGFQEDKRYLVQIASIQTLARRRARFKAPKLIVWDESHHVGASSWSTLHAAYPDAFHIGLTATPERNDGKGLGKWFSTIIYGPSIQWLIENKFLAAYKLYAPSSINTQGVHMKMGDFDKRELSAVADKPTITGDAIAHYLKLCPGKRAIVFAVSIEHSKHVVSQFNASGIKAEHVDSGTDKGERDAAIKRFTDGSTKILSNVDLFGEGFDIPSIEAAILLRPTYSKGVYLQQTGRAIRMAPGKNHAIILDHAGNCERHGLPDEEREWSLEGRENVKRGEKSSVNIKVCPSCFACQVAGSLKCNFCGFIFEVKPREVDQVEGTLVEVDPAIMRRKKAIEQSTAGSYEALVKLGYSRGYKSPEFWARHVFAARQAKHGLRSL